MQEARKLVRGQGPPGLVLHLSSGEEPGQLLALDHHHRGHLSSSMEWKQDQKQALYIFAAGSYGNSNSLALFSSIWFHFLSSFPYLGLESIQQHSAPKLRGQEDT